MNTIKVNKQKPLTICRQIFPYVFFICLTVPALAADESSTFEVQSSKISDGRGADVEFDGDPTYQLWREFLSSQAESFPKKEEGQPTTPLANTENRVDLEGEMTPAESTLQTNVGGVESGVDASPLQVGGAGKGPIASVGLVALAGAGLAGAWLLRRRTGSSLSALYNKFHSEVPKAKVLSVSPVASQASVAVVEIQDQVLLLGLGQNHIGVLTRLDGTDGKSRDIGKKENLNEGKVPGQGAAETMTQESSTSDPFDELLGDLMDTARQGDSVALKKREKVKGEAEMAALGRRYESPQEDMATQVLRRMRTMKRFR